tara:strand:+ start:8459 stop:9676 length:1218 start_codon:yes stop_codon:yes gene_type:complete
MIENEKNISNCIICDSNSWTFIYSKQHLFNHDSYEFQFHQQLILCEECGCTRVLFNKNYEDDNIANYYRLVSRTPVNLNKVLENENDPRVINANNRANFISQHSDGKKLLEIGFGDGFTLIESHNRNYNCSGIDITSDYDENITYLKEHGITIYNQDFYDFQSENKYDVITSFLLMEHVKHPLMFLNKINDCLVDNGFFVVEVPDVKNYQNFYSETQLTFEHIYHYTIETLEKVMIKGGFELVDYVSPGVGYPFALTASFRKVKNPTCKFNITNYGEIVLNNFEIYFKKMDAYKQELKSQFNSIIKCHSKIVIFGAGNFFETIIETVGDDKLHAIDYFIDETVSKIGSRYYGKEIRGVENLQKNNPEAILIASEMFAEQIKNRIEKIIPGTKLYCIQNEILSEIN